jgi:hypothetical protein
VCVYNMPSHSGALRTDALCEPSECKKTLSSKGLSFAHTSPSSWFANPPCALPAPPGLDQGTMTVYKNDERLGVMAMGLSGEYCWAVSVYFLGSSARIDESAEAPPTSPTSGSVRSRAAIPYLAGV